MKIYLERILGHKFAHWVGFGEAMFVLMASTTIFHLQHAVQRLHSDNTMQHAVFGGASEPHR